eukprot:CAMPEP_0182445492 /NCGR_PEP_ID=MMETSP1172-20130603/3598_1 /TAXON_ID=708627 /ORGANISM="Timspurckia oligopyrenoides, Strain CCMP3278" /LENGTH=364 /DNA_ID=CAMNT_0024641275 /DNA_START=65 /DNA_END=1156 /DNA_ORIENTATION=+
MLGSSSGFDSSSLGINLPSNSSAFQTTLTSGNTPLIRNVWQHNLQQEMSYIAHLVEHYNIVAMDTEFPGVVARPVGGFRNNSEYQYQTLRCNVDLLKIIQLGLAFADENGNIPQDYPCFQFNFKFNLNEDMYAQDSIDLLTESGIDFKQFERDGIDVYHFGELLISSGLVLNDDVTWISFHSSFDFGYLLKVVTCSILPDDEKSFFELMSLYFPRFWDMKYLMTDRFFGGLSKLAEFYEVQRYGQMHQAGSDSLLTLQVFFKMKQSTFNGHITQEMMNTLYGLGQGHNPGSNSNGNGVYMRNNHDNASATTSSSVPLVTASGSSALKNVPGSANLSESGTGTAHSSSIQVITMSDASSTVNESV